MMDDDLLRLQTFGKSRSMPDGRDVGRAVAPGNPGTGGPLASM